MITTFTTVEFRENMAEAVNQACYGHHPIEITRRGATVCYVIGRDEFERYKEFKQKLKVHDNAG